MAPWFTATNIGRHFRDIIGMILDIRHDILLDFITIALNQRALRTQKLIHRCQRIRVVL